MRSKLLEFLSIDGILCFLLELYAETSICVLIGIRKLIFISKWSYIDLVCRVFIAFILILIPGLDIYRLVIIKRRIGENENAENLAQLKRKKETVR